MANDHDVAHHDHGGDGLHRGEPQIGDADHAEDPHAREYFRRGLPAADSIPAGFPPGA